MTDDGASQLDVTVPDWNSDAFAARLKLAIGNESVNAFATRCGFSEGLLRKYLQGSVPGFDKAAAIAVAAGVNLMWLATGNGLMRGFSQEEHPDFALIPRYNVHASGGDGAFTGEEEIVGWLAFSRAWLQKEGLNERFLKVIDYTGYSMEPTIRHGSILLVDVSRTQPVHDQIFVLRVDENLVAKRLQHNFSLGGGLIIHSDNPDYKDQEVPPERVSELNIVAGVVWFGSRV